MGKRECIGDHEFESRRLGAGVTRLQCRNCGSVVIDLDAATDGATVTAPGLFGPSRPTIFTALAQARREQEAAEAESGPVRSAPVYAFGRTRP